MKIYYYREGRSDIIISDNDEGGYFIELCEVDEETGKSWLKTQDDWDSVASECFDKIK
jgi:hypothetical protein